MRSHQTVTCGEHLLRCGIDTSTYIVFIIIIYYSTNNLSRTTAQLRIRTTVQGLGSPPNSLLRLRETPYTTLLVFPALYPRHDFSVTQKGRVSPFTRKGLTLLPGLVRRPQHLPLGLQPRSPECSTHTSLSIRTWQTSHPDSTAQLVRSAGQTHLYPK